MEKIREPILVRSLNEICIPGYEMKNIKIGIVAKFDPFNSRKEWSGTVYHVTQALKAKGYELVWIPFGPKKVKWTFYNLLLRMRYGLHSKVRKSRKYAQICASTIPRGGVYAVDLLFFVGSWNLRPFVAGPYKSLLLTDGTFAQLNGYYWPSLNVRLSRQTNELCGESLHEMDRIITASQWAANSVIDDYGVSADKVLTLPFGANIPDPHALVKRWSKGETIELLFAGFDWRRKGLLTAVATVDYLVAQGYKARLTVVGPDHEKALKGVRENPNVTWVGKLNKNNPDDLRRFQEIWAASHCFILPTHAECAGIVFCEASAYGVPSITFDTGGVGDYVINGQNGYRLPMDATAADFTAKVIEVMDNLSNMSKDCLRLYREKFNWDVWGNIVEKEIDGMF